MGFIDLSVLVVVILLMFLGQFELGIFLIVLISLIELWALFRSQIIIQDWNNQIQWKVINKLG